MALDLPKIKAVRENLEDHQVQLLLINIEEKINPLPLKVTVTSKKILLIFILQVR